MKTETVRPIERVEAARTILIPGNSNEEGAVAWLRENGFDVPDFPGKCLRRTSEGRLYRRLRDPEIADGLMRGEADVGFLGSDKFEEWQPPLAVQWVGEVKGCDYVLAADRARRRDIRRALAQGEPLKVVTSHPQWLGRIALDKGWQLNIRAVSGKTESYYGLADLVADLRVSGRSLRDNGWIELQALDSIKLGLVYGRETREDRIRRCLADETIIGPLLVGATTQLSLFEGQNKRGAWYVDTRPRKAGQAVLRLSDKVPSDFKGLKEEVLQISPDAADQLQLNQRYAGQP